MNLDRKLRTRLLTALPVAALVFSLAACGGSADRPSVDELSDGMAAIFEEQGYGDSFTDEVLDCLAEALLASEVSDQDLANLADGRDEQTSEEAYTLVQTTIQEASTECVTTE